MSGFSFGFSGDDIEDENNDQIMGDGGTAASATAGGDDAPSVPAQTHSLDEMLSTLPSKIAYSTLLITSPTGTTTHLPRRELFDIRLQLMAEDPLSHPNPSSSTTTTPAAPNPGLSGTSDLLPNTYEGGYKSWESSLDLSSLLLARGPRKDLDDLCRVDHVVELGCGTALPTLVLWMYALREGLGLSWSLCDFNAEVLRMVTVPNLFLAWWMVREEAAGRGKAGEGQGEEDLELEVTEELKGEFVRDLRERGITLNLVSGSWSPAEKFVGLIPLTRDMNTLVLASETIYSPTSLVAFTEVLVGILSKVRLGKGMVAAKRFYFGVGGSVDGFKVEASQRGAVVAEVENAGVDTGVRRCLLEVQMM